MKKLYSTLLLLLVSSLNMLAQIDTEPANNLLSGSDFFAFDVNNEVNNVAELTNSSDIDFYRVNVTQTGLLIVNITGTNSSMRSRVEIFNPNGTLSEGYREAIFNGDNLSLEILTETTGNYFIRVSNRNSTANLSPYNLAISLDLSDPFEYNNDINSLTSVTPISLNLEETNPNIIQGKISGYYRTNFTSVDSNNFIALSADRDIYKITTNSDQGVIVMNLENVPSNLQLSIEAFIPDSDFSNGERSLGIREATSNGQPLTFELLTTFVGVYYIRIKNENGELNTSASGNTSSSPYTLQLWLDTTGNENNNSIDSLSTVNALSLSLDENNPNILEGKIRGYFRSNFSSVGSNNFIALSADTDIYKVTTNNDQGVIVMNLENVPSNLKLSLEAFVPDSSFNNGERSLGIRAATSNGQPLTFELLTTFAGEYYIRIKNENGELNTSAIGNTSSSLYTLKLSLDTVVCEFNNTALTACSVNVNEPINAKIRGHYRTNFTSVNSNNFVVLSPDVDYYQTNLCSTFISASVTNVPSTLKIKITVFDITGTNSLYSKTALIDGGSVTINATDFTNSSASKYFKIENVNPGNATNTSPELYTFSIDCSSLGIEESSSNSALAIYPNPTNSTINLQFPKDVLINQVIITDVTGKKVIVQNQNTSQVSVENLAKGIYIIEAFSSNRKFQSKFIKE